MIFCTVITENYLPLAEVLHQSLLQQQPGTRLIILVADRPEAPQKGNSDILGLNDLVNAPFFQDIEKKYSQSNKDVFRWALKPVLLGHLLQSGHEKVAYVDPDLFFTGDFSFIETILNDASVVLTPHWADLDLRRNDDSIFSVLRNGIFNAGFIAAGRNGLPAIQWWAGMCHFKMEKKKELGLYDDQRYLDLMQVQFQDVHILRHQGCNLAAWNIHSCKRKIRNGQLLINGQYHPVFIHFTRDTINNILEKNDELLRPYLDDYMKQLSAKGFDLPGSLKTVGSPYLDSWFYTVKHKLRLRTRIKKFLFNLAEKL